MANRRRTDGGLDFTKPWRLAVRVTLGCCLSGVPLAHANSAVNEDARILTAKAMVLEHGPSGARAAELYCRAARLGYAPAQYHLGWMYFSGQGVDRDNAAASAMFGLAARQGHPQASNLLTVLARVKGKLPDCMRDDVRTGGFYQTPERRRVAHIVERLAPKYQVSPMLALAIIMAESNFNPTAVSAKNAQGLMQLIPATSARFKVRDAFDPVQNVQGGLAYLRWLLAYYRGNVALVAAGYNAGEKAVDHYRGIPPYRETQDYVQRVLSVTKRKHHPYDARIVAAPSPIFSARLLAREDDTAAQ